MCAFGVQILKSINIFFLRYEVKFQQAMECGGAYVKLLSKHDALQLVSVFNLQLI